MIKGGRMSGKSVDLGKSKGKFDTVFISMSLKEWNDIQKKLKCLEIIKEKRVNACEIINSKDVREYNWSIHTPKKYPLTQEEFDLLKEIL